MIPLYVAFCSLVFGPLVKSECWVLLWRRWWLCCCV